jgi:1-phosphofructokinase
MGDPTPSVCVFAPAPLLTVTIEQTPDEQRSDEVHLHAGGQGLWIARLVAELGVDVVLCGSFGGETGRVARNLIREEGVEVRGIETSGNNGAYVHDRRSGERVETASMPADALTRHELDELYGIALVEAFDATVTVLGGPSGSPVVPAATYRRLARDVRSHGGTIIADLSGDPLLCALEGGVDVLKVSEEELTRDGRVEGVGVDALVSGMRDLADHGARDVIVTRAAEPALALVDGEIVTVEPPRLEAADHRGAGDSLTAGVATTLARGGLLIEGLRLGAAAGALNVTRHGLGTGDPEAIHRLRGRVTVDELADADAEVVTLDQLAARAEVDDR